MAEMDMPGPRNTLPMMTGTGQFGSVDMGGMFTVLKVRDGIANYADPGPYKYPQGTVAHKVSEEAAPAKADEGPQHHHHGGAP
jgi:hypothetical protein